MTPRFAVYLAPEASSALWRFGSAVVGYDAATGQDVTPPSLPGFSAEDWHRLTVDPRRYGFHGTLKAPFRLADGLDEAVLSSAFDALAVSLSPFEMPALVVHPLSAFVALVPPEPLPPLSALAWRAVEALDGLRAPLSDAEVTRRKPERLTERQRIYLDTYGYPYVRDEFRFHMTLTGALPEPELSRAAAILAEAYGESGAAQPFTVSDIALYRQDNPDARFTIVRRAMLGRRESVR